MAKYKAYPEYRDSGVIFLDNPPSHWHTIKIKHLLKLKNEIVGNNHTNFTLLSLTLNGVITRDISSGEGKIPESFATYQRVERNYLIFCLFDMDETPRTVGLSSQSGMITGAYNVYKCNNKADPSFIYYYFLYIDSFKRLKPYYTGLRKVVRSETFDSLKLHLPSIKEQLKIAIYLGHQITSINGLIEKQLQLIELLKEKRQAVISHAVTKGLNPEVPMKDSGVEWLGDVPCHWNVVKLKYISTLNNQTLPDSTSKHFLIKYIDIGNVSKENGISNPEEMFFSEAPSRARRIVKDGDVIISTVRTYLEAIAIILNPPHNLVVSTGFAVIHPQILSKKFSLYSFKDRKFIQKIISMSVGISYPAINASDLITIKIPFPEYLEQDEIGDFLYRKTAKIDTLIQKQLQQIELLKERRTALISAAVTGKIDLRDWTPPASSTEAPLTAEEATA